MQIAVCVCRYERIVIGKDEFTAIVDAQKAAAAEDDSEKIGDPVEYYTKIVNALSVARADFLFASHIAIVVTT